MGKEEYLKRVWNCWFAYKTKTKYKTKQLFLEHMCGRIQSPEFLQPFKAKAKKIKFYVFCHLINLNQNFNTLNSIFKFKRLRQKKICFLSPDKPSVWVNKHQMINIVQEIFVKCSSKNLQHHAQNVNFLKKMGNFSSNNINNNNNTYICMVHKSH